MFKHILLPTDGSKLSTDAVRKAIEFAKSINAKLTSVFVTPSYQTVMTEGFIGPQQLMKSRYEKECKERAQEVLDAVKKLAVQADYACATVQVSSDLPYEAIIKTANKNKCDLIMMASHGRRGVQALLLGSETTKVLTHSKIPVLVIR